jgi:CheY-like chemotaxis protein
MAKKILIVDDDPIIVKYIQNVLEDNGYETCTAGNSEEAYDQLENEKPDMITLDLEMPGEWGPRFYRKMAKDSEFKDLPVLVISGMAGKHAVKKAVAYLAKPFDPDKLLAIVKKTIG